MFNSAIHFLTRHKAESHQYLRIEHCDGRVEHIEGPVVLYQNPAYHDSVSVKDGYLLNSNSECIVAFVKNEENNSNPSLVLTSRQTFEHDEDKSAKIENTNSSSSCNEFHSTISKRIISGPSFFIPKPNERVHTFLWSDSSSNQISSFDILHKLASTTLNATLLTLDRFSFDAKLVISYEIGSIDKLLETQDPIKCLQNGLHFDSQTLGQAFHSGSLRSKREDVVTKLTTLVTYPSMMEAALQSGLTIHSIQVVDISLCSLLCSQIENEQSIAASTRREIVEKKHLSEIRDMEFEEKCKRLEEETALKRGQMTKDDKLDDESHVFKLAALERRMSREMEEARTLNDLEQLKEGNVLKVMKELKGLGVDMTQFMNACGGQIIAEKIFQQKVVMKSNKKAD